MKIAMLFPYAPAYREAIYKMIDHTFDVEWFFCGNAKRPLKLLDYSLLNNVHLDMSEVALMGHFRYIKDFDPSTFEIFDAIIFPGDFHDFSCWKLLFFNKWSHRRPKLILWTHGWYGRESFIKKVIKRFYLKRADSILLYGEYAKRLMESQQIASNKLFVIANSLDYDKQFALRKQMAITDVYKNYFGNDSPVIVFIGRLTFEKRLDMLLDAIKMLHNESIKFNAVFIGDGEARKRLIDHAKDIGIFKYVWFYGACFDEKTNANLIYNSDLCVSPGNVGLTAVHTLMFGCPVITHDNFPFQGPEFEAVKPGITGDFFSYGSIDSLIQTIKSWFNRENYNREIIRKNCFKEIDEHWNPYVQIEILKSMFEFNGVY